MSEKNKRLDRRFYEEVWNEGNFDFLDQIIAGDYVYHELTDEVFVGQESVRRNIATVHEGFPDIHFTIEDQITEGDRVVTRWTARGTHQRSFEGIPPTGKQAVVAGISISRISDGKFVESWTCLDRLGLLQQLGVLPATASA